MLEGLAVWAFLIYLLRLIGMPWNKYSKSFAYIGGSGWLLFVWVGLITYTPMDLSGGSLVQSPHIQLRPGSTQVTGNIKKIYVKPNQAVTKGQLIYELEDQVYQIALNKSAAQVKSAEVALTSSLDDVRINESKYAISNKEIKINLDQQAEIDVDMNWKKTTLQRYIDQNKVAAFTITESKLDEQKTAVQVAEAKLTVLQSQAEKLLLSAQQAQLNTIKSKHAVNSRKADLANQTAVYAQALWNLENTRVYAPADGYLTNFIIREGQYIGAMPRIQMYTKEKYVLMRVNHQAIRNIKVGQGAEFASAVYPGHIFAAEVEGIIEATGEAQGSLLARETSVRVTTGLNVMNKHHFVRLKLIEIEDYDIPVGAVGLAWISGVKPIAFLGFLDVIRGIIIRMKSQIYYFYTM
ncbi:Putative Multidrug resistance efflux pump [Moritella viscosa]|uniref:Putative Multidrug resistance efflux pump n=1 Tax=Moritella viscosa TaxID=80854 RepID=A0A1K9ZNZ5_9GAMM|nr:biotin/lipoyl-binding protein [Moritella viscosa]SGZ00026.1 Putative Multidrug resistance efflux pump [Moritella viscosa]SHO06093.1 Putative Multidrug resistance efflux pump [Moritella viscosa]SHO06104.1 Putative Multidrug resistance efflux pump [Moritella viscosa]SHO09561.1 Putative Multidrug resistance efflux pump [Moritella viscosa]SHO13682.1 Putative Multidrug resistance efflux pump [Moritella viscosa]